MSFELSEDNFSGFGFCHGYAVCVVICYGAQPCHFAGCNRGGRGKVERKLQKNTGNVEINCKNESFLCYISGIEGAKVLSEKSVRYSDTNLIAVVNPFVHQILVVNTPRDTLLTVPEACLEESEGSSVPEKLDAMPLHGKKASKLALEQLYGVDIDCCVQVNYRALKKVVDSLGGVDVYSECDFISDWGPEFVEGVNSVDGKQAQAFVRERHHLPDGDLQRGRNQQYMLQAILEKVTSMQSVTTYEKLLRIVKKYMRTDLSVHTMESLISWQLQDSEKWTIQFETITGTPSQAITDSSEGEAIYAFLPDEKSVKKMSKKIIRHKQKK